MMSDNIGSKSLLFSLQILFMWPHVNLKDYYFLLILCLISCSTSMEYDQKRWVGTYRSIDQTIPYPFFIEYTDDGIWLKNFKGEVVDHQTGKFEFKPSDTLKLYNHSYLNLFKNDQKWHIFPLEDTIHFPKVDQTPIWQNRARFVPILKTKAISQDQVLSVIDQKSFTSIVTADNPNDHLMMTKTLVFSKGKVAIIRKYFYQNEYIWSEKEVVPFLLITIDKYTFYTNTTDVTNPKPMIQWLDLDQKSFKWRYFDGDQEVFETYHLDSDKGEIIVDQNYALCFEGYVGEYYYQCKNGDVTYKNGNEYLLKKIASSAPKTSGDGSIIVHFNINCKGEVGRFGLQQMDQNYQNTSFGLEIVKHIIQQVATIKEWPSSQSDYDYLPFSDVHAFLMFKIKNGKIVDLCP
jgi:hypothetical protein